MGDKSKVSMKTVKVKEILLGPKYNEQLGSKDIGTYLFGQIFQARLRRILHLKDKAYICPYCSGTGIVLTLDEDAPYATVSELITDLSVFTEFKVTEASAKVLESLGLPITLLGKTKKDGNAYSAATPMYEFWLNNLKKARDLTNKRAKALKLENTNEGMMRISNDEDRLKDLKSVGLRIKAAVISKGGSPILVTCGVCGGNGYYDVSHTDLFGKQVQMMNMVYQKYIANNPSKKAWEKKISVESLYKWFAKLAVRPDIPNVLDEFVNPNPILDKQINRWKYYTEQNKDAKAKLYKYYEELYLGITQGAIDSEVTYDEILNFFKQFAGSARKKTGTLYRSLLDEYSKLQEAQRTQYLQWGDKLENITQTPYIGKYLFIEGPISQKAKKYGKTKSMGALYVYGARFVSHGLPGGYGHMSWSKGGSRSDVGRLIHDNFKNANSLLQKKFFMFFPQRVTKWQIV